MFPETFRYWKKRKTQYGDKSVGNIAEDHTRQGTVIGRELAKLLAGKFVTHGMDFGCGYGRLTPCLVPHCAHVWAVDLFGDWTGRAANASKTITPTTLSSYTLPFDDGSFDLVLDVMTLQSMHRRDWVEAAGELSRVVASGGHIITLNKASFIQQNRAEFFDLLKVADHDLDWRDLDVIDKKREPYCLIGGIRL